MKWEPTFKTFLYIHFLYCLLENHFPHYSALLWGIWSLSFLACFPLPSNMWVFLQMVGGKGQKDPNNKNKHSFPLIVHNSLLTVFSLNENKCTLAGIFSGLFVLTSLLTRVWKSQRRFLPYWVQQCCTSLVFLYFSFSTVAAQFSKSTSLAVCSFALYKGSLTSGTQCLTIWGVADGIIIEIKAQ